MHGKRQSKRWYMVLAMLIAYTWALWERCTMGKILLWWLPFSSLLNTMLTPSLWEVSFRFDNNLLLSEHYFSKKCLLDLTLTTTYSDCFILLLANKQYLTCWQLPLLLPPMEMKAKRSTDRSLSVNLYLVKPILYPYWQSIKLGGISLC